MSQSTTSGTSSRRHHQRDHDSASITSSRIADITEWEANEALRQRELEEARGRAAQMEKTMRWWSDCTANWREKWSKVRNERNKAREECKQLRTKLDAATKDTATYKRDKEELEIQNDQLKKEMEKIHILLLKHAGQFDSQIFEALGEDPLKDFVFSQSNGSPSRENGASRQPECDSTALQDGCIEDYILQGAVPRYVKDTLDEKGDLANGVQKPGDKNGAHREDYDEEYVIQKLSMLQLRLEETTKTLQVEREEKSQLHRVIDKLTVELQEVKEKCDELREAKQEAARELLSLQDQHQEEIRLIRADLQDEANSREGMDKRLNDLRAELERLQAENAAEWGKRERLETEKLALERDNKKLRAELRDMQERMERKGRPLSNSDAEVRHLQQELSDKNKEISELRHSQNKLKKMVQDKITELAHAVRRAEQYESEVKKLRSRVEELKRDLAVAEDELDTASNNIRKLQRTNDELQEQVDNFQVQLQHLHTRLRNCSSSSLLSHRGTLLTEDGSDDDVAEY
ncbi:coiled-coil domain-containing protein 102A isoform X2 [Tribolium castaneum]|uniref:Coiled-coil domain-containing protein 102A n=2 Tax=Tribolium castaneum TaxID=7070 RepID=A0A139WLI1_TRICA|nr:PREDICTED: coiled-coil domain-containing protein 102A isoform X1 [Tribolium castaneum]XP_971512.2 PREDICTED: coiled-coil domain-containing protein 102A isoform X1 [Tribolium castaneum]KYB28753.1 Coiled-coil domain-containing protein 102A-like Protein [Tribolium castaneum]|eukprot:XP_015833408.1 PREDICTED: coiled-coil domain-containing protein 102A isoform X1 [Tribolium castaneum]